jgi:uncharacterized protein
MLGGMTDVLHVPDQNRFELRDDDETAVLTYEIGGPDSDDGTVTFVHTVVPPAMEGDGVGGRLAETGVAWAREQGLDVVPVCSFVRGWLERPPEALGS